MNNKTIQFDYKSDLQIPFSVFCYKDEKSFKNFKGIKNSSQGSKHIEITYTCMTYGETRILGTSLPSSAVMALLATLAIHCIARVV